MKGKFHGFRAKLLKLSVLLTLMAFLTPVSLTGTVLDLLTGIVRGVFDAGRSHWHSPRLAYLFTVDSLTHSCLCVLFAELECD